MTNLLAGSNRLQGTRHDLPGSGAMGVFREAVLEQLSIGQNDPELIVQEVKEFCQVTVGHRVFIYAGHDRPQADLRRF